MKGNLYIVNMKIMWFFKRTIPFLIFGFLMLLSSFLQAQTKDDVVRDPDGYKNQIVQLFETADKKATKDFIDEKWIPGIQATTFNDRAME